MNSLYAKLFVLNLSTIFLKTFSFSFILQPMSHLLGLIQEKESFWWWRDRCFRIANKQLQLKKEVHATCLTSNIPDVSIAWHIIKLVLSDLPLIH